MIVQPEVIAPVVTNLDTGPPIIPFLFVTIACGAISGFHGSFLPVQHQNRLTICKMREI